MDEYFPLMIREKRSEKIWRIFIIFEILLDPIFHEYFQNYSRSFDLTCDYFFSTHVRFYRITCIRSISFFLHFLFYSFPILTVSMRPLLFLVSKRRKSFRDLISHFQQLHAKYNGFVSVPVPAFFLRANRANSGNRG